MIYVWIDALSNYITGVDCWTGKDTFCKFWGTKEKPNAVHVVGKDILRFHAMYWPAMLMGADLPLFKTLFVHGFINLNDAKISKSLGNVISPQSLSDRFELPNPDPIRYYLMSVAQFGYDGNFTEDDFKAKVNADLANNLGNLLNRTLNMTNKYFDGKVPEAVRMDKPAGFDMSTALINVETAYDRFAFQEASARVFEWVDAANKLINDSEPWNLHKEGKLDELGKVMYTVLDTLRQVAILISPITPILAQHIWDQLGYTGSVEDQAWSDVMGCPLTEGQAINLQGPILPRLEDELAGASKKK